MIFFSDDFYTAVFADKGSCIDPNVFRGKVWDQVKLQHPFTVMQEVLSLESLVFLHQVHGVSGKVVALSDRLMPFFTQDGDYLITTVPGLGIGVVTADCIPIIVTTGLHKVVAVIHAGWRGLIGGILPGVLNRLHTEFGVPYSEFKLIVGPAAQGCCYEVGSDFLDAHRGQKNVIGACIEKNNSWIFDSQHFLKEQCSENSISINQINFLYSVCTICEPFYCSYRRDKKSPLRQLTVVSLK